MKTEPTFCRKCDSEINHNFEHCPVCGSSQDNKRLSMPPASIILYSLLLIFSIFIAFLSVIIYPSNEPIANICISLATALGPVSILGLLYQYFLTKEMRDIAVSTFEKPTKSIWKEAISFLEKEIKELKEIIHVLHHMKDVGLLAAFPERRNAFDYINDWIAQENEEIYIVGTSFRGLIWKDPGDENILTKLGEKIQDEKCTIRFLLTHPAYIHLREKLEAVQRSGDFHIAQEIFETLTMLKRINVPSESIAFVRATPTIFGIMTSRFMLINPYPLQHQAYKSITFIIDSQNGINPVYKFLKDSHFKGVWDGPYVDKIKEYSVDELKKIFDKNLGHMEDCEKLVPVIYSPMEK